jgi:uncharacterized protein YndB with AHSA1/START domain
MAVNISRITINASMECVWKALTHPDLVKRWQYGSDLSTSWEPGSPITFKAEWNGKVLEQWGKVLEFKPCERLIYNLFAPAPGLEDKPENYFVMSYMLYPENGQTKLEIIQEDNRPTAVQQAVQGEENPVLGNLKRVAEEMT